MMEYRIYILVSINKDSEEFDVIEHNFIHIGKKVVHRDMLLLASFTIFLIRMLLCFSIFSRPYSPLYNIKMVVILLR